MIVENRHQANKNVLIGRDECIQNKKSLETKKVSLKK